MATGCTTFRWAISGHDYGVVFGFRRIIGLQRLLNVPTSFVPSIWPFVSESDGQDWLLFVVPILVHCLTPLRLAETLVPKLSGHVGIQSGTHHTLWSRPGTHLSTQRTVLLVRVTGCQNATSKHLRWWEYSAVEEIPVPFNPVAAAYRGHWVCQDRSPADTTALVPPITGHVLPQGDPRQQGRQVSGVVPAFFEVLQKAVRRDDLQVKDEAPTGWPNLHRLSTSQTPPRVRIPTVLKESSNPRVKKKGRKKSTYRINSPWHYC